MQRRYKEKEREIICLTSTFGYIITLTEKQVRANYIGGKERRQKNIKTTERSLQQPVRFPHIFLQGLKYHKICTK